MRLKKSNVKVGKWTCPNKECSGFEFRRIKTIGKQGIEKYRECILCGARR